MVTGTVTMACSAVGVLIAGVVISKYKPKARSLAAWNVFCGAVTVVGMICYTFLGCSEADTKIVMNNVNESSCNLNCNCDYVKYAPVCGEDDHTYISACHAGCTESFEKDEKIVKINEFYEINCNPLYYL